MIYGDLEQTKRLKDDFFESESSSGSEDKKYMKKPDKLSKFIESQKYSSSLCLTSRHE